MKQEQKLKELLDRLKKWKEGKGVDKEFNDIISELESFFEPSGDDEDDDGSNPPGGPGTPP